MLSQIVRFVLKLLLLASGLIFVVSLLAVALIVMILSVLKSLMTGKKPAPAMVFSRFQKFSPTGMWPVATNHMDKKTANSAEVVDVEVREVKNITDHKPKN